MSSAGAAADRQELARVVGVPGAVLLGLGSILGTGVFVSVGVAAGIAGPSVVLAVVLAAAVAMFNGLSSAQLAASHPVSGGTYEYGYRWLTPSLGFVAGWTFLAAKSASAATAALGFAGYALTAFGLPAAGWPRVVLAQGAVAALALVVAGGMGRSSRANAAIAGVTLAALALFVTVAAPAAWSGGSGRFFPFFAGGDDGGGGVAALLHATALMFVAYTGYGRIATLGEEVRDPGRSIPRAIVITLLATLAIYVAVTAVAVGAAGAGGLAEATRSAAAPLEIVARRVASPGAGRLVAVGAIAAMLGVLLNLLLGLSRVLLAMARRADVPRRLGRVDPTSRSPRRAVAVMAGVVAALVLTGSVETTWSFSAFTVLVYYAITNLAALWLPRESRLVPRAVPAAGLVSCLGLAFWVQPAIWATGLALIAVGLGWHAVARARGRHGAHREAG